MRELSENFKSNIKLTVTKRDVGFSADNFIPFKKAIEKFDTIRIIDDGQNHLAYIVPKVVLSSVFERFKDAPYDLDVSALDFENNIINLFKTWSGD